MKIIRVNHELDWKDAYIENPSALLQLIRRTVCRLRKNPELRGYRVYDIEVTRRKEKLQLRLYYIRHHKGGAVRKKAASQ